MIPLLDSNADYAKFYDGKSINLFPDAPKPGIDFDANNVNSGLATLRSYHEQANDNASELFRIAIDSLRNELDNGICPNNSSNINLYDWVKRPELIFFYRVTLPAWLQYGQHPIVLLRKAIQGSLEDVENLFRLDKMMISHPKLARRFTKAYQHGKRNQLNRLQLAIDGLPLRKCSLRKVKVTLAALIYRVACIRDRSFRKVESILEKRGISVGYPKTKLTVKAIRELFDAVHKDLDPNERYSPYRPSCDPDLPEDDKALEMAIRRELPFWPHFK